MPVVLVYKNILTPIVFRRMQNELDIIGILFKLLILKKNVLSPLARATIQESVILVQLLR